MHLLYQKRSAFNFFVHVVSIPFNSKEHLRHWWTDRYWYVNAGLYCRLCGREPETMVVTSRSNTMTIKFKSDVFYVDQGFYAEYQAFVPTNRKPCDNIHLNSLHSSSRCICTLTPSWGSVCGRAACPGRFQCHNNLCINQSLQCDGWNDCGDGSDEDNCRECNHAFTSTPTKGHTGV